MFASLRSGLHRLWQRKGLVVLIYAIPLGAALTLAALVGAVLEAEVAATGFGDQLAARFQIGLWADILDEVGPTLSALTEQLLWMVPLYVLWSIASSVGLIHALRGEGDGSFWSGVGRYTGRGILLALLFVLPLVAWLIVVGVIGAAFNAIWDGEVAFFWGNLVVLPTVFITGLAVLDLMHDCARIALVADGEKPTRSWRIGMARPFRQGGVSYLYLVWFVPAALLWIAPFVMDASMASATGLSIWMLFVVQQIVLLLRAVTTVGWLGSAVAFFETDPERERVPASPTQPEPTAAA